jgi:homoserine acetyltransferase
MARRKLSLPQLHGLTETQVRFVTEYIKDFDHRRAAEAAGLDPDRGHATRWSPTVAAVIENILAQRLEAAMIDPEWVLMELVDNHQIARHHGKIGHSNAALAIIAKHALVDAFAADKVMNVSDQQVIERLQRARKRINQVPDEPAPASTTVTLDPEISFL